MDIKQVETQLREVVDILNGTRRAKVWLLVPEPYEKLKGTPEGHAQFILAISRAGAQLIHEDWRAARETAALLSSMGGIESVTMYRFATRTAVAEVYRDGKNASNETPATAHNRV
jgi:hypothetical protein